jgi:CRISPR-associated protein Cas2
VAAALQRWGDRVKRSVFVCVFAHPQLAELTRRVEEIIEVDTDSVYVFRQRGGCWDDVGALGQASVADEPYFWAVL